MNENTYEQQTIDEFRQLLENVEKQSGENFSKLKDRLFNFYYDDIRSATISNGNVSEESTREEVRKLFESNHEDLKLEDLRLIKAFLPYSIQKSTTFHLGYPKKYDRKSSKN